MADQDFLAPTVALLQRTPGVLRSLLTGLPESWVSTPDTTPDGWLPRDVIGHLITAEEGNFIPRATWILREGPSRPFPPFDRFAHESRDVGVPLDVLVERFAELRASNLRQLREVVRSESDLEERGLHPELGEVTLGQLLATWTAHDMDHVAQILSALAGARDEEVGPWKKNLGILQRRDAASASGQPA